MKFLKLFILAPLVFLAACSLKLGVGETHWRGTTLVFGPDDRPKVEDTVEVQQIWNQRLGKSFDSDSVGFQIALDESTIYAASQFGDIAALNQESGEFLWTIKSKLSLSAGVNYGDKALYAANDNGVVFAFDKNSGDELWKKQLSSEVLVAPVEVGDKVVVRSQDGKIVGLNKANAESEWEIKRDLPSLSLRREIPPLVIGNVVILGLPTGNLLAVDANNGRALWDLPVSVPTGVNEIERMRDIAGQPIVNQNIIFSNSFQGEVVSIDASDRRLRWKKEISSFHQMSEDELNLYISSSESSVVALNKDTGEVVWQSDELSKLRISLPTVIGKYLLVFGSDNEAYILTKSDGKLAGKFNFPGNRVIGKPIVAQGQDLNNPTFIALSGNGSLYSYAVSDITE